MIPSLRWPALTLSVRSLKIVRGSTGLTGFGSTARLTTPASIHETTVPRRFLVGQTVTVKVRDIGRYKRTVADVIRPDRPNLNQELVRAGLAWLYQQYGCRESVLRDLEQEARAAKHGLWSDPKPVAPWEWRKAGRK